MDNEKKQSIADLDGPEAVERMNKWMEGTPALGFHPDATDAEYRKWPCVNWSRLKEMKRTPKRFRHCWTHPDEGEDTQAMFEGRLFHAMLFEPENVQEWYIVRPETYPFRNSAKEFAKTGAETVEKRWNMNATYCKDWYAVNEADGREIVKAGQMNTAKLMAAELQRLPDWALITEGAIFELPIVWEDAMTGLICKAKLDCYQPSTGQILDAKKVQRPAEYRSFAWQAYRYGYFEQAAMYRDGVNAILEATHEPLPPLGAFRFAVVEDSPPYLPALYEMIDDSQYDSYRFFQHGRTIWHNLLNILSACIRRDEWNGHNPGPDGKTEIKELTPPDGMILDGLDDR